ncbi:MAG: hypothetical protein DRI57_03100 [Deltaproteobacteria bacterium]|nr:MAG: hypothetical protein DRI57_03100 [Deltaproteobacteria bacterium]
MSKPDRIISLTEKISAELQHFVPCVPSEIEAKTMIHAHLQDIQALVLDIQRHARHTSSEKFAIAGTACHAMSYQVKAGRPAKSVMALCEGPVS